MKDEEFWFQTDGQADICDCNVTFAAENKHEWIGNKIF